MQRAFLLMATLAGATLLLGCGDTITINPSAQLTEGIQVTGTGSAFGEPDLIILSLGVSVEEKTVELARARAAEAMKAIIDALNSNGVAEEDIQTQNFSIQPQYDYRGGEQILRGYMVTNTVAVKIRDLDRAGNAIDDAAAAGGDVTRINSIQFTIEDTTALQEQARIEAMKDAEAKAQTLAEEAGITLGKPISIAESFGSSPPVYDYTGDRLAAEPAVKTPIEAGELEVRVRVLVVYDID